MNPEWSGWCARSGRFRGGCAYGAGCAREREMGTRLNGLVVGLLAVLLTGCATMPRTGDDVVVLCVKRPADYRWWEWPLAVVGYPVIVAIWFANGSDERAMCPSDHGGDPGTWRRVGLASALSARAEAADGVPGVRVWRLLSR